MAALVKGKEAPMYEGDYGYFMGRIRMTKSMLKHYIEVLTADYEKCPDYETDSYTGKPIINEYTGKPQEGLAGQFTVAKVKERKRDTSPHAYLKYTPSDQAKEYLNKKGSAQAHGRAKRDEPESEEAGY